MSHIFSDKEVAKKKSFYKRAACDNFLFHLASGQKMNKLKFKIPLLNAATKLLMRASKLEDLKTLNCLNYCE